MGDTNFCLLLTISLLQIRNLQIIIISATRVETMLPFKESWTTPSPRIFSFNPLAPNNVVSLSPGEAGEEGGVQVENVTLPLFSLIHDFRKQNTCGNVSKISVSMIDRNFGNISADVLFSKVVYQRKQW